MDEKKKKIVVGVLSIAIGIIGFFLASSIFEKLTGVSTKIDVVSEPEMVAVYGSYGMHPKVVATVKNKTNSTISVEMTCSIYDDDGNVIENLLSGYTKLAPGEQTTLVAESYRSYSVAEFYLTCCSFGNVEYKVI